MNNYKLIVAISIVALLAVAIFVLSGKNDQPPIDPNATTTAGSSLTSDGITIKSADGNMKIEKVEGPSIPVPALNGSVSFDVKFSAEEKALLQTKIDALRVALKTNGDDFKSWNSLAVYYKMSGDFTLAGDVWEYLNKAWPTNYISFYNLAELYAYELKDYVKAEKNYQTSLINNPSAINVYRAFYTFYRHILWQDDKAKATLREGVTKNPDTSQDLKYLLDHYDEV